MTTPRRFPTLLTTAALALTLTLIATSSFVAGKGKPAPEPPPEPPPVTYALQRFSMPNDYMGGTVQVQEVNNVGELVGHYPDGIVAGGEQPFYLDAYTGNTVATNLNDVQFDAGPDPEVYPELDYRIPEGWYIDAANGINNSGDIAGALARIDDSSQLRGCVIEMRPDPNDPTVMPRIHVIPDGLWSHTYALRINDVGVVLGRGDAVESYVYRAPVHGQTGDTLVTTIPYVFDAWFFGHLTNPVNEGHTLVKVWRGDDEILTYDVDADSVSFTDVSGFNIYRIGGFNDFGLFCGSYSAKRNSKKGFWFDGSRHPLNDMQGATDLNNDGDVIGVSSGRRAFLDHPVHGSISLDETIVAQSPDEQTIWDDSDQFIPTISERNSTGFSVVSGTMRRYDTSLDFHYDGYVLVPILP